MEYRLHCLAARFQFPKCFFYYVGMEKGQKKRRFVCAGWVLDENETKVVKTASMLLRITYSLGHESDKSAKKKKSHRLSAQSTYIEIICEYVAFLTAASDDG